VQRYYMIVELSTLPYLTVDFNFLLKERRAKRVKKLKLTIPFIFFILYCATLLQRRKPF
ncbi:MAG: hypothetical protein ACJAWR_002031, partial [Flavobacteriales bacterium]